MIADGQEGARGRIYRRLILSGSTVGIMPTAFTDPKSASAAQIPSNVGGSISL